MTAVGAIPVLEGADSETLIIQVASLLSQNGVIFAVIAGLILSGILAATMSTADSQLLVASSSISQDLLQDTFHLRIPPHKSVWIARVTVILIAVVGVLMAFDPNSSVFEIVSFAWAGFGCNLWPRYTAFPVLEKDDASRCTAWNADRCRRCFRMEIFDSSFWWNMGYL